MKKVRLAIIGTGGMANAQADCYSKMKNVEIVAACDINEERVKEYAKKYNIKKTYTNYIELLDTEKPDAVTVVTPDKFHKDPSMAALERNIHTMCEKPLSDTLENAKIMYDLATEKAKLGVMTAVNFSYRNDAATQKMAEMIQKEELGKVISVEAHYRQSWIPTKIWGDFRTAEAWQWRMSTKHGSLGVMGDVGVHIYDLTSFVCGEFSELFCQLDHYNKDVNKVGEYVFDANETMFSVVKLKNGGRGTIDASRWSTGYANEVSLKAFCEKGALDLNLDRECGGRLRMCAGNNMDTATWEYVACPPTPNNFERFITSIITGKQGQTSFEGAYKIQAYLDASLKSNKKQGYIKF